MNNTPRSCSLAARRSAARRSAEVRGAAALAALPGASPHHADVQRKSAKACTGESGCAKSSAYSSSSSLPHSSSNRSLPRGKRSTSCRLRSLASLARPWKASSNLVLEKVERPHQAAASVRPAEAALRAASGRPGPSEPPGALRWGGAVGGAGRRCPPAVGRLRPSVPLGQLGHDLETEALARVARGLPRLARLPQPAAQLAGWELAHVAHLRRYQCVGRQPGCMDGQKG